MRYESIRLEMDGEYVARLTLARPDIRNAMSMGLVQELRHALRLIAANAKLRAVVLTGCICDLGVASTAARFSPTEEAREGLTSFFEKRVPAWRRKHEPAA